MATITQTAAAIWQSASWDNLPNWTDLGHSLDMELLRKKSQWGSLGKSDEQLTKEIIAERQAAAQGR